MRSKIRQPNIIQKSFLKSCGKRMQGTPWTGHQSIAETDNHLNPQSVYRLTYKACWTVGECWGICEDT